MSYERVIAEFRTNAWALREETYTAICELISKWARGEKFNQSEVAARIAAADYGLQRTDSVRETAMLAASGGSRRGGSGGSSNGVVALIPVLGMISNRANMFSDVSAGGGTSVQKLTAQFRQAVSSSSVSTIVLDIDSPGGGVSGVFELAQEIYEARGRKRIIACANTLAASAAYALCAAASEVVIVPSGQCGSIGVYGSHEDHSKELEKMGVKISYISAGKYKMEGSPTEPLSEAARAFQQSQVDDYYKMFVRVVAQCRNDSQSNVRNGYGEGRVVTAARAVKANLADRVGTLDSVLLQLGVARPGMNMPRDTSLLDTGEDYIQSNAMRQRIQLWRAEYGDRPQKEAHRENLGSSYMQAIERRRREFEMASGFTRRHADHPNNARRRRELDLL
jgi:capsid assembly protease